MATLTSRKTEYKYVSDRLSALLVPTLTALEETWRGPLPLHLRPFIKQAHEGLGRLLEHELEGKP